MSTLSPSRIRQARLDAGLSMRAAAEALGVSRTTIFYAETGGHSPGGDLLGRMAAAYRVPVDAFFVHDGDPDTAAAAGTENGKAVA